MLSLSIYQAYIAISSSLLLILLLQMLLNEEDVRIVLRKGATFFTLLIIGIVVYYGILQLVLAVTHTALGDRGLETGEPFFARIMLAYKYFIATFIKGSYGIIPSDASRIVHVFALLIVGVETVIWLLQGHSIARKLLLAVILLLFPVSVYCMFLIVGDQLHTLVAYGFATVYILVVVFLEAIDFSNDKLEKLRFAALDIESFLLLAVAIMNIYIANEAYLRLYLAYENTYAFYTSLSHEIKSMPEFQEGTKVAIIGEAKPYVRELEEFESANFITGVRGMGVNMYTREEFIKYYIGFDVTFATTEEKERILKEQAFKDMQIYPYYGSVQRIGDTIVVKFSDVG